MRSPQKRIEASVGHLEEAAHELRAVAIEEQRGLRRVAIARVGAVAVALEKAKRHQRVEEIGIGPRMQTERVPAARGRSSAPAAELREQPELDRREQDLGRPEGHADFHDSGRGQRFHGISSRLTSIKGTAVRTGYTRERDWRAGRLDVDQAREKGCGVCTQLCELLSYADSKTNVPMLVSRFVGKSSSEGVRAVRRRTQAGGTRRRGIGECIVKVAENSATPRKQVSDPDG